jgi:hypothetical protein
MSINIVHPTTINWCYEEFILDDDLSVLHIKSIPAVICTPESRNHSSH